MKLWHYITHALVADMYSLEERAVMREEARRLKLRTDLQEARINARAAHNMQWLSIGVWWCRHRYAPDNDKYIDVRSSFYLEERADGGARRLRCGNIVREDTGKHLDTVQMQPFFTDREACLEYLTPWVQGSMTHDDLRAPLAADKGIKITLPKERKK